MKNPTRVKGSPIMTSTRAFTIQYHRSYQGRYITETATLEQESLEDVLQLMFRCVPGLRWIRYQGKSYGKPKNPNWQWPWDR